MGAGTIVAVDRKPKQEQVSCEQQKVQTNRNLQPVYAKSIDT